ncbi:uncharacterized protein LOC125556710 [Nematostella vectensis]|uniref:uncharacterized protein LOC125556710 n=1 Tax=Nematostella vectensis TaxID=45351 RepID=UPI002077234F|nr:uncharacterized protein LOC125556710 [Nematostella vectensis]
MKRKKLTTEAFRAKKFQKQNLAHIKEAVRDCSISYGLAAVEAFRCSEYFPDEETLQECLKNNENHNSALMTGFKAFLQDSTKKDATFGYNSELFTLYGPLLQMFNEATRNGNGHARETVWTVLLPMFAQLQFRNYWTKAFVHVVQFSALWPLAFREMIKLNCSVNISGKAGHNIDLDEFVETYIVQPLKQYASGHTTVRTCQRIMANVVLIGSVRQSYAGKSAFDVHPTKRHSEQDPFPDQLKGMWFVYREGFFDVKGRTEVIQFGVNDVPKSVPKGYIGVYNKGTDKVKDNFNRKIHECFPGVRKFSFQQLVEDAEPES